MYYSIGKFLHDVNALKDTIVFISNDVEYELSTLDVQQYRYIKNIIDKNNIKVVTIKKDSEKKLKMR